MLARWHRAWRRAILFGPKDVEADDGDPVVVVCRSVRPGDVDVAVWEPPLQRQLAPDVVKLLNLLDPDFVVNVKCNPTSDRLQDARAVAAARVRGALGRSVMRSA